MHETSTCEARRWAKVDFSRIMLSHARPCTDCTAKKSVLPHTVHTQRHMLRVRVCRVSGGRIPRAKASDPIRLSVLEGGGGGGGGGNDDGDGEETR